MNSWYLFKHDTEAKAQIHEYCGYIWHNILKYTYIHPMTHMHPSNRDLAHRNMWHTSCDPSSSLGKKKKDEKQHFFSLSLTSVLQSNNATFNHSSFDSAEEQFPRSAYASLVQYLLYKAGVACSTLYTHSLLVTVSHASVKSSCCIIL